MSGQLPMMSKRVWKGLGPAEGSRGGTHEGRGVRGGRALAGGGERLLMAFTMVAVLFRCVREREREREREIEREGVAKTVCLCVCVSVFVCVFVCGGVEIEIGQKCNYHPLHFRAPLPCARSNTHYTNTSVTELLKVQLLLDIVTLSVYSDTVYRN